MGDHPDLSKRINAGELGTNAQVDLVVWLIFQLGGDQFLLPLLVATFLFAPNVKRHPTVLNVCCTWILTGVISSLLFYAHQHAGPEPQKAVCIAQAVLISPVPPMTSVAALALVYYVWSGFRPTGSLSRLKPAIWSRSATFALLAAPYVTHLCFAAGALGVALQEPSRVSRAHRYFYCSIDHDSFNNSVSLFTAAVCLLATVLGVHLIVFMSRNRKALRYAGTDSGINKQLVVRVGIFIGYIACGMAVMILAVFNTKSVLPDMYAASIGTAFFVVFATQTDVFCVWTRVLLCRRSKHAGSTTTASKISTARFSTPTPSLDPEHLQITTSDAAEKLRLATLKSYYHAQVHMTGGEMEVIQRPEDAFVVGTEPRRAQGVVGNDDSGTD
ncbi:hypothetical protein BD413DRAFT_65818 [Trametes elegans]|nr:hypothetical protein BD413DRAFT_65818 [Trametes elegans]